MHMPLGLTTTSLGLPLLPWPTIIILVPLNITLGSPPLPVWAHIAALCVPWLSWICHNQLQFTTAHYGHSGLTAAMLDSQRPPWAHPDHPTCTITMMWSPLAHYAWPPWAHHHHPGLTTATSGPQQSSWSH